jgi:hypothetical protein
VDVPPTLLEQLQALSRSPHPGAWPAGTAHPADGELTVALCRLSREVLVAVPSCMAVAITLSRLGVHVVVTGPAGGSARVDRATQVLASLALPLRAAFGSVLVLQASAHGAFALLAGDLAALRGSGLPQPVLDEHLSPLAASPDSALAASFADLRLLDRALGVLIEQGWPPEVGEEELRRRAAAEGVTVAAVADRLLRAAVATE